MKVEDMVTYVLEKMFVFLKGATKVKNSKGKAEKDPSEMKEGWYFCGFFVFVLFGPMGLSGKTLSCLTAKGTDVPAKGRKQIREEEAKQKTKERFSEKGGCLIGVMTTAWPFDLVLAVQNIEMLDKSIPKVRI